MKTYSVLFLVSITETEQLNETLMFKSIIFNVIYTLVVIVLPSVGTWEEVSSLEGSSSNATALASSTKMQPVSTPERMELTAETYS
jgi:hypothetical protein